MSGPSEYTEHTKELEPRGKAKGAWGPEWGVFPPEPALYANQLSWKNTLFFLFVSPLNN